MCQVPRNIQKELCLERTLLKFPDDIGFFSEANEKGLRRLELQDFADLSPNVLRCVESFFSNHGKQLTSLKIDNQSSRELLSIISTYATNVVHIKASLEYFSFEYLKKFTRLRHLDILLGSGRLSISVSHVEELLASCPKISKIRILNSQFPPHLFTSAVAKYAQLHPKRHITVGIASNKKPWCDQAHRRAANLFVKDEKGSRF
ncbi:hypothetical protein HDE_13420 [Halotydeus destructor]|nr:hypothetical protein HDE_13420 [Halotydeus destructor]